MHPSFGTFRTPVDVAFECAAIRGMAIDPSSVHQIVIECASPGEAAYIHGVLTEGNPNYALLGSDNLVYVAGMAPLNQLTRPGIVTPQEHTAIQADFQRLTLA